MSLADVINQLWYAALVDTQFGVVAGAVESRTVVVGGIGNYRDAKWIASGLHNDMLIHGTRTAKGQHDWRGETWLATLTGISAGGRGEFARCDADVAAYLVGRQETERTAAQVRG